MLTERIVEFLERNDVAVGQCVKYNDEYRVEIEFWSEAGEDVIEEICFDGTEDGFIKAFYDVANDFDPDEHASMWIEGRGKRGIPDSISTLIEDAEGIKQTLLRLAMGLERGVVDESEPHKELEISLVLTGDNTFDVEIYEPESGDFTRINCTDSGESRDQENRKIISEIRSWVSMLRETAEDMED